MQIVHIIYREKFTSAYINFMKYYMKDYTHYFITKNGEFELSLINYNNVYFIRDYAEITYKNKIWKLFQTCDLIIVSGLFDISCINMLLHFPKYILNKTLLQFWGGDFYFFQKKLNNFSFILNKQKRRRCFKKVNGWIFLIEKENEKFEKIFGLKKKYFIAPMPAELDRNATILKCRNSIQKKSTVNILVGNSATESNQHKRIIDWMSLYKNENIKIYVPLSYGDEKYRNIIFEYGKEKLGKLFCPITKFMEKKQYIYFLNNIDIGIFNNERQQAMGNINILLALGKKIYLRTDTPMWDKFTSDGYNIFPIENINQIKYTDFVEFTSKEKEENKRISDKMGGNEIKIEKWTKIFESFRG